MRKKNKLSKTIARSTPVAYLSVASLKILTCLLNTLPIATWNRLAWFFTPIVWYGMKRRRKATLSNLQEIMGLTPGKAIEVGKASFHSNILVLFETLALSRLITNEKDRFTVEIPDDVKQVLDGLCTGEIEMALTLAGHSGVWELLGGYLAELITPTPVYVASKLPRNKVIANYLKAVRAKNKLILVDKTKFSRHLLKQLGDSPSSLNIFLCDQHFNRSGAVRVPFLGKSACTVSLPARLIAKYQLPTILCDCIRVSNGCYKIRFELLKVDDLMDLPEEEKIIMITERINDRLSNYITQAPEQWTWGHRRWRECCK